MLRRKKFTAQQALQRAKLYCAYQERCHAETKEKLYSFGLFKSDVESIISHLIEADYLNEERFATAYARGKFRMKQWGRVKIRYELKQRSVSEYCIRNAIKQIDEEEYIKTLGKLAEEKLRDLEDETNDLIRKKKVFDYLLQKGYERELIFSCIKE
jgi:regulatory protein